MFDFAHKLMIHKCYFILLGSLKQSVDLQIFETNTFLTVMSGTFVPPNWTGRSYLLLWLFAGHEHNTWYYYRMNNNIVAVVTTRPTIYDNSLEEYIVVEALAAVFCRQVKSMVNYWVSAFFLLLTNYRCKKWMIFCSQCTSMNAPSIQMNFPVFMFRA